MNNEDISQKYKEIEGMLDDALAKTESLDPVGEEENEELKAITSTLKSINESFKKEIEKLENSSEWDKFCIAFFGETNAGKSTIIESLRIIYDEETRRLEKEKQDNEYKSALSTHCQKYNDLLATLENLNTSLSNISPPKRDYNIVKYVVAFMAGIVIGCLITQLWLF